MARETYTEAFLDSLSRASDSIGGLVSVMRSPDWKEQLMMESDLRIKELKATQSGEESQILLRGDVESALTAQRGDIESVHIGERGDVQSGLVAQEGEIKKGMQERQIEHEEGMQVAGQKHEKQMQKTAHKFDIEKLKKSGELDQELSILEHQNMLLRMQEGSNLKIDEMIAGSDLTKEELEFQQGINEDMAYMQHYLQMDSMDKQFDQTVTLKGMDYTNEADMAAIRHVFQQQILTQQAEIAHGQMKQKALLDMEQAGYSSLIGLSDLEFTEVGIPKDTWMPFESTASFDYKEESKQKFAGLLAMYHLQVPGALQDKMVNPNSFTAQEAVNDAESAIEVAYKLMEYSEQQGYEEDADYYASVLKNLERTKARLEQ